ncbi:DM4/DM12 family [Nesidiocoris tenuis]|uniref:DM4/DM12 family n=1 Tax=Nesidiocoris tenuis TaxID=355587 RepID=A0ABN7B9T0_9HEMI|nr:DM4/DM12 family [Nesidiocoris tenuis]
MRLIILSLVAILLHNGSTNEKRSRPKRWINFPKGSSLQLVYCWLISTYGTEDGIFTVGITVGLAWEIPVNLRNAWLERGRTLHDEHRRDLHYKVEQFLDQQGHPGSACVQKAVCDARQIPEDRKLKFLQALLYSIFRFDEDDANIPDECGKESSCHFNIFGTDSPIFAM